MLDGAKDGPRGTRVQISLTSWERKTLDAWLRSTLTMWRAVLRADPKCLPSALRLKMESQLDHLESILGKLMSGEKKLRQTSDKRNAKRGKRRACDIGKVT